MHRYSLCCPTALLCTLLLAGLLTTGCAPEENQTLGGGDTGTTPDPAVSDNTGTLDRSPDIDSDIDASLAHAAASCSASPAHMAARMLELTNAARAESRSCGNELHAPVPALRWDSRLEQSARMHSDDMATHDFFDHTGSDGLNVAQRVDAAGFAWRAVGENIAAGQGSAQETIEQWLQSPGHCRNIMSNDYTHVAVACTVSQNTTYKRYWTQVFARPKQ